MSSSPRRNTRFPFSLKLSKSFSSTCTSSYRLVRDSSGSGSSRVVDSFQNDEDNEESDSWATLLPDILADIIKRIEASQDNWPSRRDVVVCGCVCKRWREVTKEVFLSRPPPLGCGGITFPSCLKLPGPREFPNQCLIRRIKENGTLFLYLALTPYKGKFLLAARRYRHGPHIEYIISLDADDISQRSNAYVGKLSSDLLGTRFTIYDSQPPHNGAKPSSSRCSRRLSNKQISPQVPAGNFKVGRVSYKFNLLKSKGPRRMVCSLELPSSGAISKERALEKSKMETPKCSVSGYTILKNKAPRWHDHLQCWCLNFHGRVTVASVKNFQLVATVDQSQPGGRGNEETVLLQFGKVGDDIYTMDYRQPLSAFQAFAICLTSFGSKLACE